jgi:hypothetical protein
VVLGVVLGGAAYVAAGPLTPPPGPIASTGKTLTEVEPRIAISATNTPGDADSLFKITQPGSYYLTGNITGVVGKHGIEIAASGVTLDLNGFELAGTPGMGDFDGVSATGLSLMNICVLNGAVRAWGGHGIELSSPLVALGRVERVSATANTGSGIRAGMGFSVSECTASVNVVNGISASSQGVIRNCVSNDNNASGISAGNECVVTGCTAISNASRGITTTSGGVVIVDCKASFNTGDGIFLTAQSRVTNCWAADNVGNGINVGFQCVVEGCSTVRNGLDGIRGSSTCVIRRNTCTQDGLSVDGAGVHVTGTDNHLEGNHCTTADRGIDADVAGNIIIKNTCTGNTTNWDVVAGNVCLVVNAATAPAILGNAGGSAPGSTDPNANFTY